MPERDLLSNRLEPMKSLLISDNYFPPQVGGISQSMATIASALGLNRVCCLTGVSASELSVVDDTDQIIHSRFNQETGRDVPQGHCMMDLLRWCHIEPLTVIEHRECIGRTGGFDERLKGTDDYLRWILVAMNGVAFGYIDEPLTMNRSWGDRFSVRHFRSYCEAFCNLV